MKNLYKILSLLLAGCISSGILACPSHCKKLTKIKQIPLVKDPSKNHENPMLSFQSLSQEGQLTFRGSDFHPSRTYDMNIYINGKFRQTYRFTGTVKETVSSIAEEDTFKISVLNYYGPGKHLKKEFLVKDHIRKPLSMRQKIRVSAKPSVARRRQSEDRSVRVGT